VILLTTTEAAHALGVSRRGVQKMIERGTIPASRVGRDWLIESREVKRAEKRPGPGRRPNQTAHYDRGPSTRNKL
jgi:excisionase family DNA binding protein